MNKSNLTLDDVIALHQSGQLGAAKEGYLSLLQEAPDDPTILHVLGILYVELGELDSAIIYLEKAVAADPKNVSIGLHLANIYKMHGLFNKAANLLLNIIKEVPNYAAAYNNLGTVYFAQAKLKSAIEAYLEALALRPDYIDAYYNLALAYIKASEAQAAQKTLESILHLSPDHVGAKFQLATLFMQLKKFDKAIKYFNEIIKDHENHFETQTNLATCYLQEGMLEEAKKHYLKALSIMPDAQVLFNLGVISMQENRITEAIDFYQQLLALNRNHFDAQNNLAIAYLVLRKKEQALYHFQEALRLAPNNEAIRHTIRILMQKRDMKDTPPAYISALFDSYAGHYDLHMLKALNYHVPRIFLQMLQAHVDPKILQGRTLDLGCGTGLCGEVLKPLALRLTGIDLSKNMINEASTKNIYDELIVADINDYLIKCENRFDVVTAGDLVVYYGELEILFSQVANVLNPKGYFIFNAEISYQDNFYMTSSGRFAHLKTYVDHVADLSGFSVIDYQQQTIRTEEGKPVKGHIYLLRKNRLGVFYFSYMLNFYKAFSLGHS